MPRTFSLILLGIFVLNTSLQASILYTAVVKGKVALPCDISPPTLEDSVVLILWYKDEDPSPIYTLDSRRGSVDQARQSASAILGSRAFFNMINKPAFLQLDPVKETDAGEYRCRVDFRKARTVNTVITLKVIVPPGEPRIFDSEGKQVSGLVGPYNEGDSLKFSCEAVGGKPRPSVTWWRDYSLLDDTYHFVPGDNLVRNQLELLELRRHDLLAVLTCQASNNNITVPASSSVTIEVNLKPLDISVSPERRPFPVGRPTEVTCRSSGSRPPASITWWKGNTKVSDSEPRVSQQGDHTVSTIVLRPTEEDDGKYFSCRAHNPLIAASALEEGWNLEVHYPPKATLQLGSTLKKGDLQEGNDIYLECAVKSNPRATEISWWFDGRELTTNVSAGLVISNQSLVLQRVQRKHRGHYHCVATNAEGRGASNEIYLRIKYAPECRPGQQRVYGAGRGESVRVSCELDADPANVSFRWKFNTSGTSGADVADVQSEDARSVATWRVSETEESYGTLACWGSNAVGRQREPCVFSIIPAGPPEPVQNCTVQNATEDTVTAECSAGYSGGLPQLFTLEVRSEGDSILLANVTSSAPAFRVPGLPAGQTLRLLLYASNAKGRSSPLVLMATTLQPPARLTGGSKGIVMIRPIMGLLIGIIVALFFIGLAILISIKIKKRRKEKSNLKGTTITLDKCQTPLKKDTDDLADSEEKGPDIIPAKMIMRCPTDDVESCSTSAVFHCPSDGGFENKLANQISTMYRTDELPYVDLGYGTARRKESDYARGPPLSLDLRTDDDACDTPLVTSKRESAV